ncbi:adenine nucleotide alpha hydrolases-like protein [Bimuria novae-zelandiae CBS 107.79]|uniref:Adenine nucleotide alpha hydrolases-like protein n=1 Tax=Bimuria novae-zelandiae CBS 107.79 TaxID=1447943 RepID=A0A6A5V8S8_9PLEO|nr:adenine nucleotide alpha hydrolases-like protein [Bimuria novae-zelandiae CBS 107.79]
MCQSFENIEWRPYWDIEYSLKWASPCSWGFLRRLTLDLQTQSDPRSDQEMIEGGRSHMLKAIPIRLRADVPVGVYLSGGIDTSIIAGMVTHVVKEQGERMGNENEIERVSCFSIAFDEDSGFDESAITNRTADHLGVKYYKKHMNEAELAARFEDATWHCKHHNPDLN